VNTNEERMRDAANIEHDPESCGWAMYGEPAICTCGAVERRYLALVKAEARGLEKENIRMTETKRTTGRLDELFLTRCGAPYDTWMPCGHEAGDEIADSHEHRLFRMVTERKENVTKHDKAMTETPEWARTP
jgi:hypothetical protein